MDPCRCSCHTDPSLAGIHDCSCGTSTRSKAERTATEWLEDVARFKEQARIGKAVGALIVSRGRQQRGSLKRGAA